jgi:hypothetical protein
MVHADESGSFHLKFGLVVQHIALVLTHGSTTVGRPSVVLQCVSSLCMNVCPTATASLSTH